MGKKKGKNKAKSSAKSTPKSTPKQTPRRTPSQFQPWPKDESVKNRFSLADEARFVSGHRKSAFEAGKKLRNMPVQFVSAGLLQGTLEEPEPEPVSADDSASADDDETPAPSPSSSAPPPDNTRAMAHMVIRSPSPAVSHASSESSDEVLFRGRGNTSAPLSTATSRVESPLPQKQAVAVPVAVAAARDTAVKGANANAQSVAARVAESTSRLVEDVHVQPKINVSIRVKNPHVDDAAPAPDAVLAPEADAVSDTHVVVDAQFAKRRGGKPGWEGATTPWEHKSKPGIGWLPVEHRPGTDAFLHDDVDPRDAAMEDYMQNMEDFGLTSDMMAASGFARREMDLDAGSHNDWESASGSQPGDEEAGPTDSWDSDMLQDLEGMSTSSDVMDTVVRILSKRNRKSGVQYLCVYEGSVVDDARWLPGGYLQSSAEKDLIQAFEEALLLRKKAEMGDSSTSDDDGDSDDGDSDDDDSSNDDSDEDGDDAFGEDEELDDETIARVLQKQEELGLGADELMLYAADDYFGGSSRADDYIPLGVGRSNRKQQKRGGRRNREPTFPSASAMADALDMDPYNGFDIMDTDRPSLRPRKKGRRGQMPFELDDSDLNEQLQNSWENDRQKKRMKKAEREELRQQGLLGRKGKAPNLKVKYKDGIMMEDVLEEMREFLIGGMQTLALPPMDASRRATIHQAADFFKLTSRSRGDGLDRFTVLTKTTRTRTYTDNEFDKAILHKGLLYRLTGPAFSQKGDRPRKSATVRFGGARGKPSTGYRDGETVGANAPEIGPENKGHALLAKMGWSKGMGLGALDNKGILQPIAHTVKMTKAGLQ
ncbi:squalene synthetase-like protein [Ascochyta rabiei]|uniref:squalene synthetase-like protein n=1 Tax=Didymella rabiei TaxID=5454 RepID=UPI00220854D8|nr:squalene synthetase-like protein [Ascochyta rabiei]UPX19485.1 squalene synthetase-like protein [Ascochyta rabiei]